MTDRLSVVPLPATGPEDVAVVTQGPHKGSVYCGTEDGTIWRVSHDGKGVEKVAHTGGRPLGIEIFPDGRLLVCDAERGVLRVSPDSGDVKSVVDTLAGAKILFANNAAIGSDGTVWFSDSSTKFRLENWKDDFVQDTRTGRLLRLDPSGIIEMAMSGLRFANGVALAADESYVLCAETSGRAIRRHWIAGPREGEDDYFVENLPGYPDNISRGSDGLLYVSIASPKDPLVELLKRGPMWVRQGVTQIPEKLQPKPKRTVRVMSFDDQGSLVTDHDIKTQDFFMVTGATEFDGTVWMGSLLDDRVAALRL
jgi:sugar lactone lactonase YvrE